MDSKEATELAWNEVKEALDPRTFTLSRITTERYIADPKRLGFFLARYKFVSKLFRGKTQILEIGAGDCFGTLMFLKETCANVYVVELDSEQCDYARQNIVQNPRVTELYGERRIQQTRDVYPCDSIIDLGKIFDGVVSLDVIEHIPEDMEQSFLEGVKKNTAIGGTVAVGTPNIESDKYASAHSRIGHINLYSAERLLSVYGTIYRPNGGLLNE